MPTAMFTQRLPLVAAAMILLSCVVTAAADDSNTCLLYVAESTIPNAGLGYFTGVSVKEDQLLGRVGDAAFATVDQDWHMSPATGMISKGSGDYHWPLTNYDWNAPDIGMGGEAEDVSVTVNGFGAAPNCHFSLLNVEEHEAHYDDAGINRYTSPGAGAFTPWWNRTSTALRDIAAGSELYVDYGPSWFESRDGHFQLVPLTTSYENALEFLKAYGKLLVGTDSPDDLVEDKMMIGDEVQKDLWDIIKTHPYVSRERQALPKTYKDGIRAVKAGDIMTVEVENSIRSLEYLEEKGKCVDNIVPKKSTIPHAGRGAFATRFIPKGGLVAPAPLVHIADKSKVNMYAEMRGPNGNIIRDEKNMVHKQIILNYCFGHPNSTLLLFPYSSNVVYINHHSTEYNAKLRWTNDFDFYHHKDWLEKSVDFLEDQWTAGLMLEFVATRDIQPGEEVFIDYGEEWQKAWDEHVKKWHPTSKESDYNDLTWWTKKTETANGDYISASEMNSNEDVPIRTLAEQQSNPYPHSLGIECYANTNHHAEYLFTPKTTPVYRRQYDEETDMAVMDGDEYHMVNCQIVERYEKGEADSSDDDENKTNHKYLYVVEVDVERSVDGDDTSFHEHYLITDVPWNAIKFVEKPYTSDIFLKNAFRHEMKIPDEIFPKSWTNVEKQNTKWYQLW
mmetsp:Transcript_6776/g.11044  ORF Transcript_6776/g.11044 Transcript_6776/m.11044 type:complete len:673 (+) Transcript_6776:77-2095(+)|eukprot:scaffold6982_cov144-Skeletonema_menzelii.AAC.10